MTEAEVEELTRYRRMFRQIARFIGVLDLEGRFLHCGSLAYALTGLPEDKVIGETFWGCDWWADHTARAQSKTLVERALAGETSDQRIFFRRADGSIGTTHAMAQPDRDDDGKIVGALVHGQDVTRLVESEAERIEALQQSEQLFEELTHRVKNSLSMIAAITRLQRRHINDPLALAAVKSVETRVVAIGELYAALTNKRDVSTVNADDYLTRIIEKLSTGSARDGVAVRLEASAAPLPSAVATSLGLIVNELVTNALKHAFPDDGGGEIKVAFKRSADCDVLSVVDSGRGLDEQIAHTDTSGVGESIVKMLALQLDGDFQTRSSATGTEVTLTLPHTTTVPPSSPA
ncbi:MAG: histidine kinase dimerization/phosphoacceptor domain -containing protein [Pseudomonadota bacterium]